MPSLDALLARIGLDGAPPPTADGLRVLHRAYVARMPYEDLTIQLGEQAPLDLDAIATRVLAGGRGGYCFELNGLLAWMLEAVGFAVDRRRAVVAPRGSDDPINHLVLFVHADGERWIADAGYGEGWLDPLRVRAGAQIQEPFTWTLDAEADDAWWLGDHEWGSNDGFQILPGIVDFAAFDEPHERLSTSPESAFVRTLVVQQPRADRIVTLRARTFSVVGPGVKEKRVTEDVDDFARVLDEQFGIDPAALGDARLTHLWSRVCEQHEAWLAAREAA